MLILFLYCQVSSVTALWSVEPVEMCVLSVVRDRGEKRENCLIMHIHFDYVKVIVKLTYKRQVNAYYSELF